MYFRRVFKHFLLIFLPSLMLVSGIAAFIYYHEIKIVENKRHILETKEVNYVDQQVQIIVNSFNTRVSDLQILCGYQEMKALLDVGGYFHRKSLAQEFLTFSEASRNYDQIRFLDETGMEIIRIDFNDGEPYILPKHQLQSKGGRYYFADTFRLNKGEVFVSPFDLNIEKGKIEIPIKPVIRFGTPIVDIKVQKRGIVIINYLGHKLIDRLKSASIGAQGHIMLLNAGGYWLHGERPEDEWGFMYEDRKNVTFANTYPDVWHEISVNKSGHFYNTNGLFTFATVFPLLEGWQKTTGTGKGLEKSKAQLEAVKYEWKIVSHVMPENLDVHYYKFLYIFLSAYGFFIVIIGFISWILANASVNKATRRKEIKRSLREIEIVNEELKCESEERKLVTNALRESEDKFRKISDTANDAIIMLDNDEKITYWNKSAENIFGYLRDETEGKNICELIIPERYRKKHLEGFERFKAIGTGNLIGKTIAVAAIRKDGSEIPIELSLSSVKIKEKWNAVGIIRDITERKQMEEQLRVSQKMSSIGRLSEGVFHEILNPVNIISAHVQLLLMEAEKGSNTEKDLESIKDEIGRIVAITEVLLKFSRKEEGIVEKIEINDLLENTLTLIRPEMNVKSIKSITKFEKGLPEVMAHGGDLRQVFLNFITNAIDAMPDGGTLTVKTLHKGDFVEFSFSDTGRGIAKNDVDKVFEPFFSTKKDKVVGVGMGLSTSFAIIESYGGKVSVESEEGKGTTVTVDLPVKT